MTNIKEIINYNYLILLNIIK